VDDLDQVAAGLACVTQAEVQLRLLLDEMLAARRALDRSLLDRLDVFLHDQAQSALGVLDELATVDLPVLLAAMPHTRRCLAVA
jgi:hypothetical protein